MWASYSETARAVIAAVRHDIAGRIVHDEEGVVPYLDDVLAGRAPRMRLEERE